MNIAKKNVYRAVAIFCAIVFIAYGILQVKEGLGNYRHIQKWTEGQKIENVDGLSTIKGTTEVLVPITIAEKNTPATNIYPFVLFEEYRENCYRGYHSYRCDWNKINERKFDFNGIIGDQMVILKPESAVLLNTESRYSEPQQKIVGYSTGDAVLVRGILETGEKTPIITTTYICGGHNTMICEKELNGMARVPLYFGIAAIVLGILLGVWGIGLFFTSLHIVPY